MTTEEINETAKKGKEPKTSHAAVAEQPFEYPLSRPFEEPDWKRFGVWKNVTKQEWESALWQRRNTVKNLKEFKSVMGHHLSTHSRALA